MMELDGVNELGAFMILLMGMFNTSMVNVPPTIAYALASSAAYLRILRMASWPDITGILMSIRTR